MPRFCPALRSRHISRLCRGLGGLALAVALSACVMPVPITSSERFVVTEENLRAIQPGVSTRADVLLMLADPDKRGQDDAYFIYRWLKASGGMGYVVAIPYPVSGGSNVTESCHDLVIRFGADGRVSRSGVFDGKGLDRPDFSLRRSAIRARRTHAVTCDPELPKAAEDWLKE